MSNKGVCGKAMATPDLLNIENIVKWQVGGGEPSLKISAP